MRAMPGVGLVPRGDAGIAADAAFGLTEAHWLMLICSCCQEYRVEEVLLDPLDGGGPRRWFRLLHLNYKIDDFASLDELAAELDARGVLMWPDDGCE